MIVSSDENGYFQQFAVATSQANFIIYDLPGFHSWFPK